MIGKKNMSAFVDDLKTWGTRRVKRVIEMTRKYGVLMNSQVFSDGRMG